MAEIRAQHDTFALSDNLHKGRVSDPPLVQASAADGVCNVLVFPGYIIMVARIN